MFAKFIPCALVLTSMSSAGLADPRRPPPAQACAVFDVHVLTLLEEHGRPAPVMQHGLSAAIAGLIDARSACYRGDYELGLDRYSRIDLKLAPALSADLADER